MHNLPNLITCLRIVLVVPIIYALLEMRFNLTLLLFAIAGASDALDGFLARRFNWQSRLGAFLDPLADKILLMSSFYVLGWIEVLPIGLVAIVLVRDLVIMAGAASYYLLRGKLDFQPLLLGKLSTVLQVLCGLMAILAAGGWMEQPLLLTGLIYLTALLGLLSGIAYVVIWSKKFIGTKNQQQGAV